MARIRVVLVEDHFLTRMGLKSALDEQDEIEIVGEAADGQAGLDLLTQIHPDVAIVDIGLPEMDGIELTQRLRRFQAAATIDPATKVLMLTLHTEEADVLAAFAAGADSYCVKDISLEQLLEALRTTAEGQSWIDPAIAAVVLQQVRQPGRDRTADSATAPSHTVAIKGINPQESELLQTYPLTERELEVLELIVGGYNNTAIAQQLHISMSTVKTHVRNILSKLSADDRTQAAVRALRAGLIE